MIDFDNQVALVTGAGRGLGLAYAKTLAARGATVVVQDSGTDSDGASLDPAIAKAAASAIVAAGGRAMSEAGPLASREDCAALVNNVVAEHGRLDVLIHNAGFVGYQEIEALEPEFLDRLLRLGIDASLWLAQAAWPIMRRQRYGRILLTTSDRAIYPAYAQAGLAAYAAAKLAVVGIVNNLALEGREHGINVNAVSPVAKTRMWGVEDDPDELHPDMVAPGVVHLASAGCQASGWVLRAANGQFVATQAREATGVAYPRDLAGVVAATPEEVARAWYRITVAEPEPRRTAVAELAEPAFPSMALLGECPVWSERRKRLLWVDTDGRTLNSFDPASGRNQARGMPDVIGMVAERADGALVTALGCDLATVDDDGQVHRFTTAPHASAEARLNDGRFDEHGRLWVGLMSNNIAPGSGFLYRYDPDGRWHVMDDGFALVNGLDWSPDRRTLYVTDSRAPALYAYDHDTGTGAIGARRTFATFAEDEGFPDGLLVAPDGSVWSTLFAGGAIQEFHSNGARGRRIRLPVSRPTSCCFSADGRILFVTTAQLGLDDAALAAEPLAGSVLYVPVSARGTEH